MKYTNIYSLFRAQTARYADRAAFFSRDAQSRWSSMTWSEFETAVHALACALGSRDVGPGVGVAILAGNRPEWAITDLAAVACGAHAVGLYPTSSPQQCEYIINHSDSRIVVVDLAVQRDKIESIRSHLPNVQEVLCVEDGTFAEFSRAGDRLISELLPEIERRAQEADPEAIPIIVYTSGTTGEPKGAMLSHRYVLNSVESLRLAVPVYDSDVTMSYLPGCHVAERISGIYNRLYSGATTYFIENVSRLADDMTEIAPTVFASLPRFFEKIHARLLAEKNESQISPAEVRDAFGGRVRLLTSGGAPLPGEIAMFFAERGLPILQAYGLTENVCVAFNTAENMKFGTVGRPMPLCELRLAADSEIELKSPMMFSGYYKDATKSAEMFTHDGWLRTGDLGALDDDGYLSIVGRKKEIIVLSSGKNVAPALIENLVKESHLVSHCFVAGDGHSYCVALITLNEAEMSERSNGSARTDRRAVVEEIVRRANAQVSSSEQIKRFAVLDKDFSPGRDEITPTMKLKRNVVAANYKEIIEGLYE